MESINSCIVVPFAGRNYLLDNGDAAEVGIVSKNKRGGTPQWDSPRISTLLGLKPLRRLEYRESGAYASLLIGAVNTTQ